jgi:predicted aspartyl protease
MGENEPRFYAAFYNKQADFHFHMVKVEGKINNQPIAILIDSGSSHSYLDPKMGETFQFPRNKLGKPCLV